MLNWWWNRANDTILFDLLMIAFKVDSSPFREEGLSNPGVPEHRGLITPPGEKGCEN